MQEIDDKSTEYFKLQCKKYNLKITPQRRALYTIIKDKKTHPSAQEIYREVIRTYPNISFDTINRTLNTFAEIGLIDTVEGHGEPRKFDPNKEPHHHLHCIRCGKIIDFNYDEFDKLEKPSLNKEEFEVTSVRVVITGVCKECRKKEPHT